MPPDGVDRRLVVRIFGVVSERQVRRAGRRCAKSSGTSGRRWDSSSATTCGCCASAPATTRVRGSSTSSRCFTTSTTRGSPTSTTTWSRAGICTSRLFDWHLQSGDSVHAIFDVNPTYERLFETFEISPGVFLPPGEYRFTRFRTNAVERGEAPAVGQRERGNRLVLVGPRGAGDGIGRATSCRPGSTMSVSTNQTFARLPEGDFIARIFTTSIGYTASPRLSFSNLIQYDNRSRNLGWQSRVRWTLQPGNDLFFAFNQGWVQESRREPEPALSGAGQPGCQRSSSTRTDSECEAALVALSDAACGDAERRATHARSRELGAWTGKGNTTLGSSANPGRFASPGKRRTMTRRTRERFC